jgi:rhamnopyranosyl-N-acetylglucosaminyl-diphospho-decaprenol beta-1,3/1,4-galactofuranosyltransferase
MKKKILAAVVTRNRIELLKRCINHLVDQSYKLSEILIINNDSSDGTLEFLKNQNYTYINQVNSGSAGGWNSAIKYFLKKNYDYIWLMDDDGYPDQHALNNLLDNYKTSMSCLSSVVVQENNPERFVFPMSILKNDEPILISIKRKEKFLKKIFNDKNTYNYAHLFNGALIHKNTILKIGNVEKKYFISGDDLDYYYRLKKVGTVTTLVTAIHYHPNVDNRKCSMIWIYYYVKNSIIVNNKYTKLKILRNFLIILRSFEKILTKNGIKFFFHFFFSTKLFIFLKAIYRGFSNKLDHDYEN